jgi:arsenical pump membrane protein
MGPHATGCIERHRCLSIPNRHDAAGRACAGGRRVRLVGSLGRTRRQQIASRLFLLIYCVGTIVTVFLSNDATAVVLTPAVYAAVRKAKVDALPYLLGCAFIAKAASFLLPISNPANIVVFDGHLPPLLPWMRTFLIPSLSRLS